MKHVTKGVYLALILREKRSGKRFGYAYIGSVTIGYATKVA